MSSANAHGHAVGAKHNGVALDVLRDFPGKQQILQLLGRGLTTRDHLEIRQFELVVVGCLDQQPRTDTFDVVRIAPLLPGASAWEQGRNTHDIKRVGSGLLIQTADNHELKLADLKVVTRRQPTPEQLQDLLFAWKVAQYVKSNAIVFCANGMTMGVGAGQMSRLDSARIASIKAEHAGLSLKGTAVASDAFFPFRDGLDVVVDAGASCVAQPGGSMRDQEVIDAANERDVAMVFTGVRHFRH
mgnify:CR=1